ncbi:10797_t:CDS:2, partial [Cetraspora pellucida]
MPAEILEDIDEDPESDARTYVESNWPLFEQTFKRIRIEKLANNWRQVRAMMEESKLLQIEEEIQEEPRITEELSNDTKDLNTVNNS